MPKTLTPDTYPTSAWLVLPVRSFSFWEDGGRRRETEGDGGPSRRESVGPGPLSETALGNEHADTYKQNGRGANFFPSSTVCYLSHSVLLRLSPSPSVFSVN